MSATVADYDPTVDVRLVVALIDDARRNATTIYGYDGTAAALMTLDELKRTILTTVIDRDLLAGDVPR